MRVLKPDAATIDYYEKNFSSYAKLSSMIDMHEQWGIFVACLKSGAKILDVGCGSGRDIKYFLGLGFVVDGLEPSTAMAEYAQKITGAKVYNLAAEEIDFTECYDGIWACASLLHMSKSALIETAPKIFKATKRDGYIYVSLKRGVGEVRDDEGRYFSFYEMEEVCEIFLSRGGGRVVNSWLSSDKNGRVGTQWINLLLQKI